MVEYEGSPAPGSQRLIFAGALLRDHNQELKDVLKSQVDLTAPQVFHMAGRCNLKGSDLQLERARIAT